MTYFAGRALSVDEAQSIVEGPPFRMVEAPTISDGIETRADSVVDDGVVDGGSVGKGALSGEGVVADDEAAALIDKARDPVPTTMLSDGPGLWRMDMEDQTARLQEIAHADFDNDGVGDISGVCCHRGKRWNSQIWSGRPSAKKEPDCASEI